MMIIERGVKTKVDKINEYNKVIRWKMCRRFEKGMR
jgi:hypothetical protein